MDWTTATYSLDPESQVKTNHLSVSKCFSSRINFSLFRRRSKFFLQKSQIEDKPSGSTIEIVEEIIRLLLREPQ